MDEKIQGLPENAFRELKEGEVYEPLIPAEKKVWELTIRSIFFGIAMAVLFSCAATYIALKLGQGIETAIPIAILAVGFSQILKRKSTLIENVNILAIGATSGIIVGGSVFVMPAIFILDLKEYSSFFEIFFVPLIGAILGVLFLIPFRRYFVKDQHGKLPFPEATATVEVLVAGEKGGKDAIILLYSIAIGWVFDTLALTLKAWRDVFTTSLIQPLSFLTDKIKMVFSLSTTAAIAGLGYLIGVRYAAIIFAGSLTSFFILVPLISFFGNFIPFPTNPSLPLITNMSSDEIFSNYVRYIGIGGIFAAGIISILKMGGVIKDALGEVFKALRRGGTLSIEKRTEIDIKITINFVLIILVAVVLFLYFRFFPLKGVENPFTLTLISVFITLIISFLFAAVSAWAVAMISITPVSGMTLTTLIISCVILTQLGLKGKEGMLSVLLIGGVVCTALSMTGSLVTQFKLGYWLGSTPKKIEWSNIFGSIIASVFVTLVMFLLAKVYGFTPSSLHKNPLPAPQANAMAAVVNSIMGGGEPYWLLYGVGAVFAIIMEIVGVSPLAFALGMYLPLELNSPILIGSFVAYFVKKSSKDEELNKKRYDKGLLIASGLIAGGALAGVFDALVKFFEDKYQIVILPNLNNSASFGNFLGLLFFLLLCFFIYFHSCRIHSTSKR